MKKWFKIDAVISEADFVTEVRVAHKQLCLLRDQGKLYAVENTCPHAGGILSGGWCENGKIICPIHRWVYDLKTGRGGEGQGDYIYTYPVETRPDGVYVELKQGWMKTLLRRPDE